MKKLALRLAIRRSALRTPQSAVFFGVSLQHSGARFERDLLALLDALPRGCSELMVHPGHVRGHPTDVDTYTEQRETELDALRSGAVRARLARGDIRLTHFGRLTQGRAA
jgi:predicted glycoside hydrolase/deacetylase ChbG (UPF0249 family)